MGTDHDFRRRLIMTTVLASGILLIGGAGTVRAACTGAVDGANRTDCIGGSSAAGGLVYVDDNAAYVDGDFELLLQNHDVTGGIGIAIDFSGVVDGTGTIILQDDSDVTGSAGFFGINALSADGDILIDIRDTSSATGITGIVAASAGGDVTIKTAADSEAKGNNGNGISAGTIGLGNVDVEALGVVEGSTTGISAIAAAGTVEVTTGEKAVIGNTGTGIEAEASGRVTIETGGNVTGGFREAISAESTANGDVTVTTAADTTVESLAGAGIYARTSDENGNGDNLGNVEVTANGIVTGAGGTGIIAAAIAGSAKVTTGAGAVTGMAGDGIVATGSGVVTVKAGGDVIGTGGIGINAVSSIAGVEIETAAETTVEGTNGNGISAAGSISAKVTANGAVTGSTNGIDANATGIFFVSGEVSVKTGAGKITGTTGKGIEATASGAVTVETGGAVEGATDGIHAASSGGGLVQLTTLGAGGIVGTGGAGITAGTTDTVGLGGPLIGQIKIVNSATVRGDEAAIIATSATGVIDIDNINTLENISGSKADLVIRTTGGPTIIRNRNILRGRVETGAGSDVLTNDNAWFTQGDSDFGAGADRVENEFELLVGATAGVAEEARFLNLESLVNKAGINLQDETAGNGSTVFDRLETSGDYSGETADLFVDAYLGGAGSGADMLSIGGDASGLTRIYVNDTNAGAGGYVPDGIVVVHVDGLSEASAFSLANGPIDKGLFTYDLLFDAPNGDYLLVSRPDSEVFETLAAVAGAQEVWRESAAAWSTRQENLRDVLAMSHQVTAVADPVVEGSTAPAGSFWMSALGSWTERDDEASFAGADFDQSYKQNIYGFVGGADFRAEIGDGANFLFGAMGGYVASKLDFDDSSTRIENDGATLGIYAGVTSGGFFATLLGKVDLLTMDYTAGGLVADDSDEADVTSYGVRGDFGYRFGDGSLFLEPILSVDAMSTKIDEFSIGGADIDAGTNESYRVGAGLRAGYGGEMVRASATARIWDELATDNEVDILAGAPLGISDGDLEGVYGDVSGQLDFSLTASTTLYLKGGILFSDDVTKPNASGGVAFYW